MGTGVVCDGHGVSPFVCFKSRPLLFAFQYYPRPLLHFGAIMRGQFWNRPSALLEFISGDGYLFFRMDGQHPWHEARGMLGWTRGWQWAVAYQRSDRCHVTWIASPVDPYHPESHNDGFEDVLFRCIGFVFLFGCCCTIGQTTYG